MTDFKVIEYYFDIRTELQPFWHSFLLQFDLDVVLKI